MRKRTTAIIIALVALILLASCDGNIRRMDFDIPEEFWGTYTNDTEDLVISQHEILENGMPFEEYLLSSIGVYNAAITDFRQNSSGEGRYTFTFIVEASVSGQKVSLPCSVLATTNGNSLTLVMTVSTVGTQTYTYTRIA